MGFELTKCFFLKFYLTELLFSYNLMNYFDALFYKYLY